MSYQKSIERLVLSDTSTLRRGLVFVHNLGDALSVRSSEALARIRDAIVDVDRLTTESDVQLSSERSTKLYSSKRVKSE